MTATTVKTILALASAQLAISVDGKTQADVMNETKAAGHPIAAKTLSQLMRGKATELDGWTLSKQEVADEQTTVEHLETVANAEGAKTEAVIANPAADNSAQANADAASNPAPEGNADAGTAATDNAEPPAQQTPVAQATSTATGAKGTGRAKKPSLWERIVAAGANPAANNAEKYKDLTPEQKALAEAEEAKNPTNGGKISYRGTDWSKVLPKEPQPVKKDSKVHKFLELLTRPEGVTKEECCKEMGWTAGGFAGMIHWEPKAKGYVLDTEKKDGKIHYRLKKHIEAGGGYVKPGEVVVAEPKPAPAPKAPKAPKAAATDGTTSAPAPAGKVRVPKDGMNQAAQPGAMGGVTVTRRVANKKS